MQRIFPRILAAPTEEREGLLEELCGEDQELRSEIESLVEAHDRAAGFLEESVSFGPPTIDRYRILRLLGSGGMGEVYLAARDDASFEKRVAIKILRSESVDGELIARFQRERQILAALEHPNIARLLDGGTTEDGRPYLVMECVEGRTIDAYCDELGLSVEQRLELFLQVCSAVDFAHRNLVVHRDIKAGNILVNAEGVPKLLDFGIAKLLNPELTSPSMAPTVTALRLMTPEAASPEQVQGGAITTSTDVYSLGVLLYRLLTGHPPYSLGDCSAAEAVRRICEAEPEDPSQRVMTAKTAAEGVSRPDGIRRRLSRRLGGDIDRIVQKALRKEPWRRYGSAQALTEDIQRHLSGLPVLARPSSWSYRWGKGLARNRVWVIAAVLLLFVGAVLFDQMRRQRDLAREAHEQSVEMQRLLVDLFEVTDPLKEDGGELSAREVLERGARRVLEDLDGRPRLQAELLRTLGVIHRRLALHEVAATLLDQASVRGPSAVEDPEWRAATLDELGMATLDALEAGAPREETLQRVEAFFREALDLRRARFGEMHPSLGVSFKLLGNLAREQGNLEEASANYRRSLEMWDALGRPDEAERATVLNNLANVRFLARDLEAAEIQHREALELRRLLFGGDDLNVAESANNLAVVLLQSGQIEEALDLFEAAVEVRRQRYGEAHPRLLRSEANLAAALHDHGRLDEAEARYRSLLEAYDAQYGPKGPASLSLRNNLASLERERGRFEEAAALYQEVVDGLRPMAQEGRLANALVGLGNALERSGRAADAMAAATEALELMERNGAEPWRVGTGKTVLGGGLRAMGRPEEARVQLEAAEDLLRDVDRPSAIRYRERGLAHLADLRSTVTQGARGEPDS